MTLKLMVVGGSILQLDAVIEAKRMGLDVAVVDFNPLCVAKELADKFYPESTHSEEDVLEAALRYRPDGIITLCTDWAQRSVSYACERLKLRAISYETAKLATDKLKSIQRFRDCGISHPHFVYFHRGDDIEPIKAQFSLPCIAKPIDSSGSRGVVMIHHEHEWQECLDYAASYSKEGSVVIQDFMDGPEVSVEVIILKGEPRVLAITDKTTTGYPHFVETMHVQPTGLSEETAHMVRELAVDACRCLELNTGAAHVEIIVTKDGPKLVEVGARMGGDFISTHLVKLSTGINMTELVIREALGLEPTLSQAQQKSSAIIYLTPEDGIYQGIDNLEDVLSMPGVVEVHIEKQVGDELGKLSSSVDRLGHILVQAETREEVLVYAKEAKEKLIIKRK